jgi:hypothetical protein
MLSEQIPPESSDASKKRARTQRACECCNRSKAKVKDFSSRIDSSCLLMLLLLLLLEV